MVRRMFCLVSLTAAMIAIAGFPVAAQSGRTFYIDYANGSNSNNGTGKSTPWKTHPYMDHTAGCDGGNGPTYTHQAGDHFVFKGGDSWPAACFEMYVTQGGTSSASDYYGVDTGWYTGSSFSRPLFNLNGSAPSNVDPLGGHDVIFVAGDYVTFDNIEIKDQFIVGGHSGPSSGYDCGLYFSGVTGGLVENVYFHDWVTDTANLNAGFSNCAGGLGQNNGSYTVQNSTFSDQNGTPVPFGGCAQNPLEASGITCEYVAQGTVGFWQSVHDSTYANITNACCVSPYTNGIHTNVIEETMSGSPPAAIYNNLIYNNSAGVTIYTNYNSPIYNNVLWNNYNVQIMLENPFGGGDSSALVGYIFNNTVDCSNSTGPSCVGHDSKASALGTLHLTNNLYISNSSNGPVCFGINGCGSIGTLDLGGQTGGGYTLSTSQANTDGLTPANKYQPSSSASKVLGSAANLTSSCSGLLAQLCYDAQGAPWFGGTYVQRPTGSSWVFGAFSISSSTSQVAAPINLTATVE